jgi:hypothetical protein
MVDGPRRQPQHLTAERIQQIETFRVGRHGRAL